MTRKEIPLTSSEIAQLWSAYLNDSAAVCFLKHFLNTVQDCEIGPLIESTLDLANGHLTRIEEFFTEENIPIPHGFNEMDVNPNAKKLFSDPLILQFIKNMGSLGMSAYSMAASNSARRDVREYFTECLNDAGNYHNIATDLLLSKGLFVRPPYIPVPEKAEFVQKASFLNGFFGDQRPVNAIEIGQLFYNLITNVLGKAMMIAFSQTAQDKEVRDFITRGREIASKHVEAFASKLSDDHLPAPNTWDAEISDSKETPFSDKLMLFQTTFLIASGIGNYGISIALCERRDLGLMYGKLMAECISYAVDGAKLLIERGWMEKPPGAVDRDALVMK